MRRPHWLRPSGPSHGPRATAGLGLACGLCLVAACIDYGIVKPGTPEPGGDDTGTSPTDGGTTPPLGACGELDLDAEVAVNEACIVEPVTGEFDPVVEWSLEIFASRSESDQVVMAPVVGHLTDDDGDGAIGHGDIPDVVVVTDDASSGGSKHGILRVLSGRDGTELAAIDRPTDRDDQVFPYRYSNVALGDVDADGSPEMVLIVEQIGGGSGGGTDTNEPGDGGMPPDTGNPIFPSPPEADPADADMNCTVGAFNVDGSMDWVASDSAIDCAGHAPALADLDGDGHPEVVVGNLVLNGEDGSQAWKGAGDEGRYYAYTEIGTHTVVSDLDGDGLQEVIAGRTVYAHDGSIRCTAGAVDDGFAAVADLDGDGQGEFVLVGNGQVSTFDTDCGAMASWTLGGGGNGGPPTIGDLDNDGQPEIALCSAATYAAYEVDGTEIWSQPVSDHSSHATGSLIFDFESDGSPEVVYADEVTLYVFDGPTGTLRLRDSRHASRTLHDYPTVADVDSDGSVEIIVPNGGGHYDRSRVGVYVLGSASDSWQSGREVWNQHAYSVTNINDDLSIPAVPAPNWPTHNTFRSGDPNPDNGDHWPDAVPVAEVCKDECDAGTLVIDVALANQGAGDLRAGVPVHAWYEADGLPHTLEVSWTATTTAEGAVSAGVRIRADAAAVGGRPVYVVADEDADGMGYADECEEGNNMLTILDTSCEE